jgi:hypothetical protein
MKMPLCAVGSNAWKRSPKRAETIIEVQKKLSDLLGLSDPSGQKNEESQ